MIYPEFFPKDREGEHAEKKVFDALKTVADRYDIFYSRKFVEAGEGRKPEYEIDFIIAIPDQAILCLEVKGGAVNYDGMSDRWTQNSKAMDKRPDSQASAASHALTRRFSDEVSQMPVGWGLCFPDCQIQHDVPFPSSIDRNQVIDEASLLHIDSALPGVFDFLKRQNPGRSGARHWQYSQLKQHLLRGLGFVQLLGTRIKYQEKRFVELTGQQLDIFKRIASNDNLLISGPAGSGKTILAKTVAQDLVNEGKRVLLMCFNRTLANKIRYEFSKREELIEVATFHSLAREVITSHDAGWWDAQSKSASDDFWEFEVPEKMLECLPSFTKRFDVLIVDEGQDFKEYWFELIFQLVPSDGKRFVFMDQMQNIFGHFTSVPASVPFVKFQLTENCRNTREIVSYLSNLVGQEILSFSDSPQGAAVVTQTFKNALEQQKFVLDEIKSLIKEHDISASQILLMLNSPKAESCLANTTKVGRLPIQSLDNKGRMNSDSIQYTTINTFKGLEADVVFVLDMHLISDSQRMEKLYTEASRARHKLYLLGVGDN